jgi:hypothetical protein
MAEYISWIIQRLRDLAMARSKMRRARGLPDDYYETAGQQRYESSLTQIRERRQVRPLQFARVQPAAPSTTTSGGAPHLAQSASGAAGSAGGAAGQPPIAGSAVAALPERTGAKAEQSILSRVRSLVRPSGKGLPSVSGTPSAAATSSAGRLAGRTDRPGTSDSQGQAGPAAVDASAAKKAAADVLRFRSKPPKAERLGGRGPQGAGVSPARGGGASAPGAGTSAGGGGAPGTPGGPASGAATSAGRGAGQPPIAGSAVAALPEHTGAKTG